LPLAGAMRRISVVNPTGEKIADDFRLPLTILMQNEPWPSLAPRINPMAGRGWMESICCVGWRSFSY